MPGLDGDFLPFEATGHVHQAPGVVGDEGVGARLADAVQFAFKDGAGDVGILDGEGASETAALFGVGEVFEFDALDLLKQLPRLCPYVPAPVRR